MKVRDNRGQSVTEYVLLLAMVVAFFLTVSRTLRPYLVQWSQQWSKRAELQFSKNLHRFR